MEIQQPFVQRPTFYPQSSTLVNDGTTASSSPSFIVTAKAKVIAIFIIIVLIILAILAVYVVKTNKSNANVTSANTADTNSSAPSTSAGAKSTTTPKKAKNRLNIQDIYKNVFDTEEDDDEDDEFNDGEQEDIYANDDPMSEDGAKVEHIIRRHASKMKAPPQNASKRVAKLMRKYKNNPTPSAPYIDTTDTDITRPPSTIDLDTSKHSKPVLLPHNSPLDYDGHYTDDIDFAKKRKISIAVDQDNRDTLSMASTTLANDAGKQTKTDEKSKK